jgi:AcrR family transcriptional regulator
MLSKDEKRQRILNAAIALFSRSHDVKKVSVEDIAAEARFSPTTIYNYFGTREALVIDTAKVLIREIMKMSTSVMRSDLPFPQKLKTILAGKMDLAGQYSSEVLGKLLSHDMSVARAGREIFETEVRSLWLEFINTGKNEGYIDTALDDEVLLTYFDIMRAGLAARPELVAAYGENMPQLEKLTEMICFGFLKKEIDLFPGT